jgi:hypothetical protein
MTLFSSNRIAPTRPSRPRSEGETSALRCAARGPGALGTKRGFKSSLRADRGAPSHALGTVLTRSLQVAAFASTLGACAELPPEEPLQVTRRGAQQVLTFEVEAPAPREGLNELIVRVTEDGVPVDGLELELDVWMDVHDHAAEPVVAAHDDRGTYRADVLFSMPGTWTVSLLADGEVGDSCVIFVEVE